MSNYQAYLGVTKGKKGTFRKAANLEGLLKEHPITDEDHAYIMDYHYMVACNNDHDCRETLINCTWNVIKALQSKPCWVEAAYFRGYDYSTVRFSPQIVAKINKLAMIVNNNRWKYINLSVEKGVAVIGIDLHERVEMATVDFPLASLLFWIIRNEDILTWCAKYADNNPTEDLTGLLEALSVRFLAEEDWGDDYNENLPLSFFCYNYANGGTYKSEGVSDGPEYTAENNLSIYSMRNYVREVAIPFLKRNGLKESPKGYGPEDLFIVHDDLSTEFSVIFKSLLVSEWE